MDLNDAEQVVKFRKSMDLVEEECVSWGFRQTYKVGCITTSDQMERSTNQPSQEKTEEEEDYLRGAVAYVSFCLRPCRKPGEYLLMLLAYLL